MNPLINLSDVTMRRSGHTLLDSVSLDVDRGDFIAVTGPNGGGKTTLLRIMLKLIVPDSGTVSYNGDFRIGYLPQKNSVDARFPMSVTDVVRSGLLGMKGISSTESRQLVKEAIATVGLEAHCSKSIGQLSGGQLQRTLLARALVSHPEVLVLDEPLSYLDKAMEARVYEVVGSLKGETTIVLVSHEMSTIASMATRHLIVDGGLHECHASHHSVHYDCDD